MILLVAEIMAFIFIFKLSGYLNASVSFFLNHSLVEGLESTQKYDYTKYHPMDEVRADINP